MTEKWAPGPHHASGPYVFAGKDCVAICDTDNAPEKRMEANATLFAAASDLYCALKAAEEYLAFNSTETSQPYPLAAVRAALAKARGEA